MYQLIYLSRAKNDFGLQDLVKLLDQSRENNKKCSVRGILLYIEKHFFQLLEGDEEAVSSIMEKVKKDPRHEGIIYLYRDNTILSPLFPYWSMGFPHMKFLDIVGWEGLAKNDFEETLALIDAKPDSEPGRLLKRIIMQNNFRGEDMVKNTSCQTSDEIKSLRGDSTTANDIKMLVMGPAGAGITTYIATLSEVPVISTEERSSEDDIGKLFTAVALDYGSFKIDDFQIHLFGTPGHDRFDFMWDVLSERSMGLVLLLNGSKVSDFSQARKILDFASSRIEIPISLH